MEAEYIDELCIDITAKITMQECGNSHGYFLYMMLVLHVIFRVGVVSGHSAVSNAIKAAEEEEAKHNSNCASTRRVKRHDHARFPSSPPIGTTFGKALRFYGREVVRFSGAVKIPSYQLTVDLWVKPEGGQPSPVTVLGLFDDCSPESKDGGWVIGFREASPERSLRVFFTLRTQRSQHITTLLSPRSVEPNVWLHIAVTFDGKKMKLYINQAEVAVSTEQKGHVFANGLHVCENLEVGGNRSSGVFFRGTLDEVRLWSVAKSHEEISSNVFVPLTDIETSLEMYESFAGKEELNRKQKTTWIAVTKDQPEIVQSTIPGDAHYLSIFKPPCGTTVCDNAEIVKSYAKNTHLRGAKVVRYRVVNIRDDDGNNPMVTKEQMKLQHAQLNKAFKPHNISFELTELPIKNSSLRRRSVMYLCEPGTIGDGICNVDCMSDITGNDGGDCDKHQTLCHPDNRGNGRCDPECNRYYNAWDFGDCCNESITDVYKTCFDPKSPNRAYISVRDYKSLIKLDNKRFLNVFVAQLSNKNLHGLATFPWEKSVQSIYGGIIMSVKDFGHQGHLNALVHEFGHVLGLWHVFHGVTEMDCTDECAENFPSLELGDLCSDTNPTPPNFLCSDPLHSMTCGLKFYNTPFKNFMGLANDSCTSSFTEQQAARMHCYLDLIHQSCQDKRKPPSFIPLPPRVTYKGKESIKLAWIPPLGTGGANAVSGCHECRENRVFQQYAVTAKSPKPPTPNGYWAPHQAIGAPDAEPCILTPKAWTPLTMADCQECYIELGFKEAVIPTRLSVWVTRESKAGISDIQLVFTDESRQSLGNATAQCDSPLTIALKVKRKVTKVVIYVNNPLTAIDAVQLTSSLNHPNCLKCEPMEYLVTRIPPFSSGKSERVKATRFEDRCGNVVFSRKK